MKEGFKTYVVIEGTKAVDASKNHQTEEELSRKGVNVIGTDSEEVRRLRESDP